MPSISHTSVISLAKVIILGLLLGLGIQFLHAWTAPGAAAPGGNVSGPITAGLFTTYQIRNAGLGLTGSLNVSNVGAQNNKVTAPKICLNNDGSETGCITAWPTGGTGTGVDGNVVAGCGSPGFGTNACGPKSSCWGGATVNFQCPTAGASTCYVTSTSCPADSTLRYTGTYIIQDCGGDGYSSDNGRAFICVSNSTGGTTGGTTVAGDNLGDHTATQNLNMSTVYKIVNLKDPTQPQDAATKAYVDSKTSSVAYGGVRLVSETACRASTVDQKALGMICPAIGSPGGGEYTCDANQLLLKNCTCVHVGGIIYGWVDAPGSINAQACR